MIELPMSYLKMLYRIKGKVNEWFVFVDCDVFRFGFGMIL